MDKVRYMLHRRAARLALYVALLAGSFVVATAVWGETGAATVAVLLVMGWLPVVVWRKADRKLRFHLKQRPTVQFLARAAWVVPFFWHPVVVIMALGELMYALHGPSITAPNATRLLDESTEIESPRIVGGRTLDLDNFMDNATNRY